MKIKFTKSSQAAVPSPERERPETHYHILGVPPASSYERIHERYRELALAFHPDVNPQGEERFKAIALAWGVLRDETRRKKYDAQLLLEGRFSCVTCSGRGFRTKFGKKLEKDSICETCNGKGEV